MFHIGQKIIRIAEWACDNPEWRGVPIQKDEIHAVRGIVMCNDGDYTIYLEGIHNPVSAESGREFGYNPSKWAPYNPPAEYIAITFSKLPEPCAS